MDAQQELFSTIKESIKKRGYDVYDCGLPPDKTPYPFVYLGDVQSSDDEFKSSETAGTVNMTIHIWSNNPKKRGDLSDMISNIKKICRNIKETNSYSWFVNNLVSRIIPDNTTKEPLIHGVIEVSFRYS